MISYRSTRGRAPTLTYPAVMTAGLADDGGLYLPTEWPTFTIPETSSYPELVAAVVSAFTEPDLQRDELAEIAGQAYADFAAPEIAPLRRLDERLHLLELFWGPTLAFKDFALQLLGRLIERTLAQQDQHLTILGATSGDTGSAAIAAFAGLPHVDVVILHPEGRVSEVQRRQMTTVLADNVYNLAIAGNFDDCQAAVKRAFLSDDLDGKLTLGSANSINWMRVAGQVAYYAWAAMQLGPIDVTVPSGNFGNVFSGYVAKRGNVRVEQLVAASNRNHVLATFVDSGVLEIGDVSPTLSPSMDIQVPSNLERMLFELYEQDSGRLRSAMQDLGRTGVLELSRAELSALQAELASGWIDDEQTLRQIESAHRTYGVTVDPHTAVALAVAQTHVRPEGAMVVLGTAHPAKFPDAVARATGARPELPAHLADLLEREERYERIESDELERWLVGKLA